MDENLHNIDDLFKKALEEHNESVSPDIWKNIDKSLDKKKIISISESYRKLKWIAAALLIFSAGMAMYTFTSKIKNKETVHQNKPDKKRTTNKDASVSIDKNVAKNQIINIASRRKNKSDSVERKQSNLVVNGHPKAEEKVTDKLTPEVVSKNLAASLNKFAPNKQKPVIKINADLAGASANKTENNFELVKKKKNDRILAANNEVAVNSQADVKDHTFIADVTTIGNLKHRSYESFQDSFLRKTVETLALAQNSSPVILANSLAANINPKAVKSSVKGVKQTSFSAGLFFSPDFVNSRIDNGRMRFGEEDRNEIRNKEKIKNAFSAGLVLNYYATRRFSFQTGISFSTITTDILPKTIYARPDERGNINYRFNCSAGYSDISFHPENPPASGDSISSLLSTNTLQYISVPLAIKYNITKGRFSLQAGLGIASNFLIKGTIQTQIVEATGNQKEDINHIDGLNKMYLNGLLSFGINYNINRNFAVNFTPVSRFALTAINKDAPVKTYLSSFGLQAGISFRL